MDHRDRYAHKTVQAVRGTDRMIIAQWQKRGWELVESDPGVLRTELTFRRKKSLLARPVVLVAVVAALALVIGIGVLVEKSGEKPSGSVHPSDSSTSAAPVRVVKDASYPSGEDVIAAASSLGFTCPSPKMSGATMESSPRFIYRCANDHTIISLGDSIVGGRSDGAFILGLDEPDFRNGPWLVGVDWAINGPGVEALAPVMGGKLVSKPVPDRY